MLSAHIFEQSVGRYVDRGMYRGLPTNGPALVALARQVRGLSLGELTEAIRSAQSIDPQMAVTPLSGLFSLSEISMYKDAQLAAYKARLRAQPGGQAVLEGMRGLTSEAGERPLANLIAVRQLERLRTLGAPTLKLLRHHGAQLAACDWQVISQAVCIEGVVRSLTNHHGQSFELPQSLLANVDQVQDGAWRDANALRGNSAVARSASVQTVPTNLDATHRELYVCNLNTIAALALAAQVSQLPEAFYERLVAASAPHGASHSSPIVLDAAAVTLKTSASHPVDTSIHARRLEHPDSLRELATFERRVEDALLQEDLALAAGVLRYIDTMRESVASPEYERMAGSLRAIQQARHHVAHLVKMGMLSRPVDGLVAPELVDKAQVGELLSSVGEPWRSEIKEGLARYQHARAWLEKFSDFTLPPDFRGTELLSPAALAERYTELRALIADNSEGGLQTERALVTERSSIINTSDTAVSRGELTRADYSIEYFKRFLIAGNHALYRPKDAELGSGIDGLFLYCDRHNFPASIQPLKQIISQRDDVAYESLFLTAKDRAKGTYMMLLRGMGARQVLAGVRFSLGTVRETNEHHFKLLQAVDHTPLLGAPVVLDALQRRYLPMLWRLP
jgi:hypothetical protein